MNLVYILKLSATIPVIFEAYVQSFTATLKRLFRSEKKKQKKNNRTTIRASFQVVI
jgi:hypothetical protein